MQGLVLETVSDLYKVEINNKIYTAKARGKLKKDDMQLLVGDIVKLEEVNQERKEAVIGEIKERKNYIKRPKMSNVNQIILVVSSKNPKPDLLMLDKQLAFSEFSKITPIIVLNKVDLDKQNQFKEIKEIYSKVGYKVLETEATNKSGIESLIKLMKGNINAFSGNSGVGKSTLINAIFNEKLSLEGEISQKNKRGKNTTTSVKLYKMDENTYIADTPGFSTFDISDIASKDLYKYFKEFSDENCKYVGCTHIKEEDCGIKQDVKCGKIDKGRYDRFCKIYKELKQMEERKW